jgi:hypothetical protein
MIPMTQHALESLEMSTNMASTLCPKGIQHFAQQGSPKKCIHSLERTQAKGSTILANNLLLFNLNSQNK